MAIPIRSSSGKCPPGCNGKRRYTKANAKRKAARLQELDGDTMIVYRCSYGGYHVGHKYPAEARKRREINASKEYQERQAQIRKIRSIMSSGLPVPSNRGQRKYHGHRKRKDFERRQRRKAERNGKDWYGDAEG